MSVSDGVSTVTTLFKVRTKCGGSYTANPPTDLSTAGSRTKE
jgi:hypothetical protein